MAVTGLDIEDYITYADMSEEFNKYFMPNLTQSYMYIIYDKNKKGKATLYTAKHLVKTIESLTNTVVETEVLDDLIETFNTRKAIDILKQHRSDLVVLEIELPNCDWRNYGNKKA